MNDRELLERVLWQGEANACALAALHDAINYLCRELKHMSQTTDTLSSELTTEQTNVAALTSAVGSLTSYVAGVPALIAAAIQQATAAGAPPETLAAFQQLNADIANETAALTAALPSSTGTTSSVTGTSTAGSLSTGGTDTVASPAASTVSGAA